MGENHNKGRPIQGTSTGWLLIIRSSFLHFQGSFSLVKVPSLAALEVICRHVCAVNRPCQTPPGWGYPVQGSPALGCMTSSAICQDIAKPALSLTHPMLT